MAVVRGHVSGEAGHSRGLSLYVLGAGLALVAGGMLLFGLTVLRGLADAHGGGSSADHLLPWLPAGGLAVVAGVLIAALGMLLSRHAAGE